MAPAGRRRKASGGFVTRSSPSGRRVVTGTRDPAPPQPGYRGAVTIDAASLAEEDALWHEWLETVDAFGPDRSLEPGYFEEGWTAKDGLAHVGTWLAEAGAALEQIRSGSYVELQTDELDALNARFLDAMRDVPLPVVRSQAIAARARMLHAWTELAEPSAIAERWIRKSGPDHYREHLPRMHAWLDELRARHGTDR